MSYSSYKLQYKNFQTYTFPLVTIQNANCTDCLLDAERCQPDIFPARPQQDIQPDIRRTRISGGNGPEDRGRQKRITGHRPFPPGWWMRDVRFFLLTINTFLLFGNRFCGTIVLVLIRLFYLTLTYRNITKLNQQQSMLHWPGFG